MADPEKTTPEGTCPGVPVASIRSDEPHHFFKSTIIFV
jgi:hypothetical protein